VRTAFHKEIVRSIVRSRSRFAAIFLIVALGAGFYAGLRMCAPDMRITVDRYLDETAFMDAHLVSTLGFSDADVAAVKQAEGVAAVMPTHIADVTATIGERRATVRVHELDIAAAAASDTSSGGSAISRDPSYLNRPIIVAGRWPRRSGECVIDRSKVFANTAQIGQSVSFTAGVRPPEETFGRTDFTIVGVVDSSYYLAFNRGSTTLNDGNVDRVVYIPSGDFADPATYTDLFVSIDGAADAFTFSSEYRAVVQPVARTLEALAPVREEARLAEVKAEAQTTLDEKRAEYDEAKAEADTKLADASAELDAAAATIASSEHDLAAGQRRYEAGVRELAAQRRAFATQSADAQRQIDAGRAALAAQQGQLDQLAAALPALQQQIAALQASASQLQAAYEAALAAEALGDAVSPSSAELAASLAQVQAQLAAAQQAYATQSATYDAGVAAIATARAELTARQAELDAGKRQAQREFSAAQRTLDASKRQLAAGRAELAKGKAELADGRDTYAKEKADAEAKLADGLKAIEDAQATIDDLEKPTWYVLGRGTNVGYASLVADTDRIEAISLVFPFIFFLVAALVALTTMTRMVDEERTLIGTYKALGYGKGRIASKYLVYAGLASVLGSIAGILIGSQALPRTVWQAYTTMYTAPSALTPIDPPLALMAGLASVGVTLVATLWAVEATLRESPANLMLPRAPKPGKRIFLERVKPLWSRLSFLQKVTARNLFRYKKRLLMTVIGIAGCTALLLTGFGLKDSIGDVLGKQYGDVYAYTATIGLDVDAYHADVSDDGRLIASTTATDVASLLNDSAACDDHLVVRMESIRLSNPAIAVTAEAPNGTEPVSGAGFGGSEDEEADGAPLNGYLLAPSSPKRLDSFIHLRERVGGKPLSLSDDGVVITEKASDELHLKVGDTIEVERLDTGDGTSDEPPVALTVVGITEQYVSHYVYLTPELYERTFGEPPANNVVLAMALADGTAAHDALSEALLEKAGVTTVQFNDDITSSFADMLDSLDSVVFVLIFSAGMLAFIVLYNLTNINVTERQREIATIKVLGFYDSEVNAYIYRETAALTVLGCALGLLLGIALEAFVITTVEIDIVMFGRTIHAPSYVYSAALTLLFAVIVNIAMWPRLRGIDMVESLKSIE
jgi:putative ABC transport system permease protein